MSSPIFFFLTISFYFIFGITDTVLSSPQFFFFLFGHGFYYFSYLFFPRFNVINNPSSLCHPGLYSNRTRVFNKSVSSHGNNLWKKNLIPFISLYLLSFSTRFGIFHCQSPPNQWTGYRTTNTQCINFKKYWLKITRYQ